MAAVSASRLATRRTFERNRASLASYASDARKPSATAATVNGAADALLSYGEAAQAEELYNVALTKGGGILPPRPLKDGAAPRVRRASPARRALPIALRRAALGAGSGLRLAAQA